MDGVSYKFVIDGFPATYRFWMRLPAAWSMLIVSAFRFWFHSSLRMSHRVLTREVPETRV